MTPYEKYIARVFVVIGCVCGLVIGVSLMGMVVALVMMLNE